MAVPLSATILRHLHLSAAPAEGGPTDAELLRQFVARQDQDAFAALVRRHGPMVWRVCRAVLGHEQEAEDAFQAAFLVLARKAASLRNGQALAGWLHSVAVHVARRARRGAARRRAREERARGLPRPAAVAEAAWRDLQTALDEEVQRLPEQLRVAFVLCFLEGRAQADVARELGCRPGTVSARLCRARQLLLGRLSRRGVSLSAGLTAVVLSRSAARAALPRPLTATTVRAALACAAAHGDLAGVTSTDIAALVREGVPTMVSTKLKVVAALTLFAGLLAAGAGARAPSGVGREEKIPAAGQGDRAGSRRPAERPKAPAQKGAKVAVRGKILGPDGKPCPGARLLFVSADPAENGESRPSVVARSGADGAFQLAAPRSGLVQGRQLVAVADGYGPDWIEADRLTGRAVTFRLVKDVTVVGRILDLEGRPVKDVTVRVKGLETTPGEDLTPVLAAWNPDGNRLSRLLTKYLHQASAVIVGTKTDAAGRFRLGGVGRDRVAVLRVEGPTIDHRSLFVLCRPGLDVKKLPKPKPPVGLGPPTLPALYGLTFEHVTRPTRPVAGKVTDRATGKPLAGVHVIGHGAGAWWGDEARTVTDAQGRYHLLGLPKGKRYGVRAAAGLTRSYLPSEKGLADAGGLAPLALDFELVRGVRVRGRVTEKGTGKPVVAALWYFPLSDNKYFRDLPGNDFYRNSILGGRTNKDGAFSLLALPGSGVLKFRAEVRGENPYTQVALDPAHRKRVYRENEPGLGTSFLSAGGAIETLRGHNAYRLIEPALGTETLTCDVQVNRGKALAVKVVGPDGKALTGATVSGVTALGGIATLTGDSFTALALTPERPRTLTCVHPGRKLAGQVVLGGKEAAPVMVRLQPWAELTGRLLDEDGNGMAGASVRLFYATESARGLFESGIPAAAKGVKTDASGAFRIEGVFPGTPVGLVFVQDNRFRNVGGKYRNLSLKPGQTSALGDIASRPFP